MIAFYLSTLVLLAPLVTCVGVGLYWGRKSLPFSPNFLALLVTSVSTPGLVFHTLVSAPLDNRALLDIGLVTVVALTAAGLLCALALRLLRLPVRMLLQTATFPNAGNLGLPIAQMAFGPAGLSAAVVFFSVCAFAQNTVGVRSLPGASGAGSWKSPVIMACLAAVVCRALALDVPAWVMDSAKLVGSLTVPLMLISLGYALSNIPASGLRRGSVVALLRLVIGGFSGWLATGLMGVEGPMRGLLILQMSMPCAVISYMFASRYTNQAETSAGAVLVSTIVFLVLSPVILALVGAPL